MQVPRSRQRPAGISCDPGPNGAIAPQLQELTYNTFADNSLIKPVWKIADNEAEFPLIEQTR